MSIRRRLSPLHKRYDVCDQWCAEGLHLSCEQPSSAFNLIAHTMLTSSDEFMANILQFAPEFEYVVEKNMK